MLVASRASAFAELLALLIEQQVPAPQAIEAEVAQWTVTYFVLFASLVGHPTLLRTAVLKLA